MRKKKIKVLEIFDIYASVSFHMYLGFLKLSLYLWKRALWELQIDISVVTFLKMYLDVGTM